MKISQKQRRELVVTWCFAIFPTIALFRIYTRFSALDMATGGGAQNAALFPKLLSYLLLFFVLLETAGILFKTDGTRGDTIILFEKQQRKNLLVIFLSFLLYLIGLTYLGYYVSTPLILIVFYMILGIRKIVPLLLLSLGTTFVIWYLFYQLLNVVLPVGTLGLYF